MVRVVLGVPDPNVPVWEVMESCEVMINAVKWRWGRPPVRELWVDSGGFQVMLRGLSVELTKLVERYRRLEGDAYISLDIPPKTLGCVDRELLAANIRNFEYLYEKLDRTVVPVIHCTFAPELVAEAIDVYRSYGVKIVACGAAVPSVMGRAGRGSRKVPVMMLALVRKLFPGRIHVLGVGGSNSMKAVLSALRIESTDSSSWRVKAAYGKVLIPGVGERYVGNGRARFGVVPLSEEDLEELRRFLEATRFPLRDRLEELLKTFVGRALVNAWVSRYAPPELSKRSRLGWMVELARRCLSMDLEELVNEINSVLGRGRGANEGAANPLLLPREKGLPS